MPTGVYVRRKLKRKKKRPKGYVPPPSPSKRETPWANLCVRSENYAMLRELGEYYEAPLSKIAAALITRHFIELLRQSDPEKADALEEEYKNEKYAKQLIELAR